MCQSSESCIPANGPRQRFVLKEYVSHPFQKLSYVSSNVGDSHLFHPLPQFLWEWWWRKWHTMLQLIPKNPLLTKCKHIYINEYIYVYYVGVTNQWRTTTLNSECYTAHTWPCVPIDRWDILAIPCFEPALVGSKPEPIAFQWRTMILRKR